MPPQKLEISRSDNFESRLDQFSSSFKSEADLRLALIALLEKLPNTRGIRHTHGTSERGKDIVFISGGPFDTEELIACVVKNTPITGSVESNDGARTVFHQAEQTLDTPILSSKGEEQYVSRTYVITPYECKQDAIDSIKGKLAKPDGTVKFLYGRELYELFEKHYPDYLVFRSGLFGSYISDLEAGISRDSAIANLLMKHGLPSENHDISKIYVQPTLQIVISKHFALTEWPDLSRLYNSRISEDQMLSTMRSILAFSRLIALIAEKETSEACESDVRWLAESLRELWKRAYTEYQRNNSSLYTSERMARHRVALLVPGISQLNEEFQKKAEDTKALFNGFGLRLINANELADSKPSSFQEFLDHPYRFDYSFVRGIAAQLPALFEVSAFVSKIITTTNRELMASADDVLITAPAGFGKSSFCKWNVLDNLKALKEGTSNVIPALVSLHQVAINPSIQSNPILSSAGLEGMWSNRGSADNKQTPRRFRLYLDGLDEVPDPSRQQQLLNAAKDLKKADPTIQIILTGREHLAGTHLNGLSRLQVAEMSDAQSNELIEQWFSRFPERKDGFKKQLASLPSMKLVMKIPLLATLVLSVYESTSTLPESRIRLYEMFIGLMAGGWDTAKKVLRETEFGSQPKITILQFLAGRLHLGERRDATVYQFNEAVRTLLPALEKRSSALLEEIMHDGLLMPVVDGYAFSHLSFQEYLAAKDLMEPKGRRATDALAKYLLGNDWWNGVLSFYVALSGQPKEMETFVRSETLRVAQKHFDPQIPRRAQALLGEIATAFPGAKPNFKFPEWKQQELLKTHK